MIESVRDGEGQSKIVLMVWGRSRIGVQVFEHLFYLTFSVSQERLAIGKDSRLEECHG